MSKKKMTPAQKAAARWSDSEIIIEDGIEGITDSRNDGSAEPKSDNNDHVLPSILLVLAVVVVGAIFTVLQGGTVF